MHWTVNTWRQGEAQNQQQVPVLVVMGAIDYM